MGKPVNSILILVVGLSLGLSARQAVAQSFGVELHNTLMPASGGMGGVSIALPQDVQSPLAANPATLTQFSGTQFSFGGAWVEPTYNVQHTGGILPGIGAFGAKSEAEGSVIGNIAVAQDFSALGIPATVGMGLLATGGAGISFRDVPASNGTTATFTCLQVASGVGIDLTDCLSAGATVMLGNASLDGIFVGLTGAAYDYALRGSLGVDYDIGCDTTIGGFYHTRQSFNFDDAISLQLPLGGFDVVRDIDLDLPENIGFGIANESLMCGNLLLAADVLYKDWEDTDLFGALYENQWVFQFGAQYKCNERVRLRVGYVFAENITDSNPGNSAGGVTPPGAQAAIQYVQAQLAAINRHRLTAGVGLHNVLPGVDLDLFAGGMFHESEQFGAFTSADVESYWIGLGITWRFGGEEGEEPASGQSSVVDAGVAVGNISE